jgi:GR25 family glycosyltransferase involved in LPS biosynthesis
MRKLFILASLLIVSGVDVDAVDESASFRQWPQNPASWPVWVISLARLPKRIKRFRAKTDAFSEFPRIAEFPATDGNVLDFLRDKRVTPLARLRTHDGSGRRSHSDLQTAGMAGLYISHVELWKEFLASGEAVGIVLEDDAVVNEGLAARMEAIVRNMPSPSHWDVWLLGTVGIHMQTAASGEWEAGWDKVTAWWGTQAYALTRHGAAKLLAHAYPTDAQIDAYMANMATLGEIVVVTRSSKDIDVPQFAWWQQSTSIQKFELFCDTCSLPNDFSLAADNNMLVALGGLAGFLLALIVPAVIALCRLALPPLYLTLWPKSKRRS